MDASLTRGTLAFRTGAGNFGNNQENGSADRVGYGQCSPGVRKHTGAVSTNGKRSGMFWNE